MEEASFDWLNPFASVDLGIGAQADGIKSWAIANRESIQPEDFLSDNMYLYRRETDNLQIFTEVPCDSSVDPATCV